MSPEWSLRGFALALFALLAAIPGRPASAAQAPVQGNVSHVWPKHLGQGYFPLWVGLRNVTDQPQPVEITVKCGMGDDETSAQKRVELAAGEQREVELFVPVFDQAPGGWGWTGFAVSIRARGWMQMLDTALVERTGEASLLTVLVLGDRVQDEATEFAWSTTLSTTTLSSWTASSTSTPNVDVASARYDEHVPTYAEAYSSLDLVVLDLSRGAPTEEALGPLLRWVRQGGRLLVVGGGADAKARAIDVLAPWMEERFIVGEPSERTVAYTCGHGVLLVCAVDGEALERPAHVNVIRHLLDDPNAFAPARVPATAMSAAHLLTIPGVGDLPYGVFLVLLLGFAVVIGPVNFVVLRKLSKPFLLIVTVPAISLLASLAIFLYGAFAQGFGAKAATRSLTILDQRSGWASTVEHRSAYFPLSPASGLRPEAGTSIFPFAVDGQRRFAIDLTQGTLLANGFLPVRTQVDYIALSDRPAHLRVRVSEEDGELVVHNELDVSIERLFLRDAEGRTHDLDGAVEPGGTGTLEREMDLDEDRLAADLVPHDLLGERELLPSTFVAELSGAPFLDDCGVEAEVLAAEHVLYGVLEARQEEW